MNSKTLFYITIANLLLIAVYSAGTAGTDGVKTAGGTTVITACQTGFQHTSGASGTNDSCTACAAGTTANLEAPITGFTETGTAPQATACINCAANYQCAAPSPASGAGTLVTAPVACAVGEGSAAGQSACITCGTGVATCTVAGSPQAVTAALTCQDEYIQKTVSGVVSCVTPTIKGCQTGTSDGTTETCTVCGAALSGYQPQNSVSNACTACTSQSGGCGTCDTAATEGCTACNPKLFYKTADATFTCKACATGCLTCPDGADGATKCSTVDKGWKLSAAAPATPTACGGDGKTSEATGSIACDVACTDATNCLTCNKDQAKCELCKDNFELQADGTCKTIPAANIHGTCQTANKFDSADNCTSCDGTVNFREMEMDTTTNVAKKVGKCMCKGGYSDASTASVVKGVCEACGTGAKTCDLVKKMALTCTNAAQVVAGNVCKAKGATDAEGYFYNTADSTFKTCHATCVTCTGGLATNCSQCPEAPASWVEPTSLATNYATYIQGTRALINNTCFGDCPTGFVANSLRTSCVAGAATTAAQTSGILAIISLLATIFLIF